MTETEVEQLEYRGVKYEKCRPVNRISGQGGEFNYEYTFDRVYPADVPEDFKVPTGAEMEKVGEDILFYQYRERPRVLVTSEGAYVEESSFETEAENQAYFILSVLDAAGFVGGFSKK